MPQLARLIRPPGKPPHAPGIPGWFGPEQAALYDRCVAAAYDGAVFIELGCLVGRSTIYLAKGIQASGKRIALHAVDWFQGRDRSGRYRFTKPGGPLYGVNIEARFRQNLTEAGVANAITIHPGESPGVAADFPDAYADMVFLDASHDYPSVVADIKAWSRVVKPLGVFAGDDYSKHFPGVVQAVNELVPNHILAGDIWQRRT